MTADADTAPPPAARARSSGGPAGAAATGLVLWYPALWAVGLGVVIWPALAVATSRLWVHSRLRTSSGAVLVLVLCLILSAGVGLAAGYGSLDRLVGFGGNLAVWLGLFGLLCAASAWDLAAHRRFLNAVLVTGIAHSCVAVASVLLYPRPFPLPLTGGIVDRLPPAARAFMTNKIAVEDWLGRTVVRSNGMLGFPTWSGAMSALTVVLVLIAVQHGLVRLRLAVPAVAVSLLATYYAFSRAVEIALVAVLLYAAARVVWRRYRTGPLVVLSLMSLAGVLAVLNLTRVASAVASVNGAREGSMDSRDAIYTETLSRISDLGVPVLGFGLKPRQEDLLASVASHSTYLGLLFKAGILGLVAFLVLLFACWSQCRRATSLLPASMVMFVGFWCVLEDFDTGHLVPIMLVAAVSATRLDAARSESRTGPVDSARPRTGGPDDQKQDRPMETGLR
jgi:hypothetical protein